MFWGISGSGVQERNARKSVSTLDNINSSYTRIYTDRVSRSPTTSDLNATLANRNTRKICDPIYVEQYSHIIMIRCFVVFIVKYIFQISEFAYILCM